MEGDGVKRERLLGQGRGLAGLGVWEDGGVGVRRTDFRGLYCRPNLLIGYAVFRFSLMCRQVRGIHLLSCAGKGYFGPSVRAH